MENFDTDTIAALSTPLGRGGIAVIRVSGQETRTLLKSIIAQWPDTPKPRKAYHSYVVDRGPASAGSTQDGPHPERRIDECVVLFFKGPHSYTGEDVAEISIHSNPFLVEEVLNLIYRQNTQTIRNALPGEFTFRAFKNGKMDLIQAEAVKELIDANSRYYAHMTFGSLEGRLSQLMRQLKEDLITLGVRIETKIEFEEDQFFDEVTIAEELDAPIKRLETLLTNARFNEQLNKGLSVVIVGNVNVGKSSLFNTLLMEERSIISEIPGTTRDFIREKLYIDGLPIDITDVAGINRDTQDSIESLGIQRSLERLESADAVIYMADGLNLKDEMDDEVYRCIENKEKLIVVNKLDGAGDGIPAQLATQLKAHFPDSEIVGISVKNHYNIDAVTQFLKRLIATMREREAEFTVNQRQQGILEELNTVLTRVRDMVLAHTAQAEIIAEEIRGAINLIGRLMGEVTPEDILNRIFSSFCVGK